MVTFRVHKNKNYTAMSNHHLRNTELSLKAKGLHSQMLSLPDTWKYSIEGLAKINKEGVTIINNILIELEKFGYLKRTRARNAARQLKGTVYDVYEEPIDGNPEQDYPKQDEPEQGNKGQLNTKETNTEEINTDYIKLLIQSYPIL